MERSESSSTINSKVKRISQKNLLSIKKEKNISSKNILNNFFLKRNSENLFNYKSYIPNKIKTHSKIQNKQINSSNLKTIVVGFDRKKRKSIIFKQYELQLKLKEDLSVEKENINNEISKIQNNNNLENIEQDKISKKNVSDNNKESNRRIFRKKYLYDSLEDSEEVNGIENKFFCISPESKISIILDFLNVLCLNLCLIYIPLKISFYKNNCVNIYLFDKIVFYLIDIIFIIDLFLNFFKAYYNNQFNLITNNKKIIKNYLITYFFYDFISAIPFLSLIIYYYENICLPYNINNNRHILLGISFILKLSKYRKVRKINKFLDIVNGFFSRNYYAEQIFSAIIMSIKYLCVLHLFVCCHIFIGYHSHPSWLISIQEKFGIEDFFSIYICSFYYLITTLTTVGYGDIVCISLIERIFQIIELAVGIVLYSYIVSKLGGVIKRESYSQISYNNSLAILEEIRIAYPKMSYKLYHRIFQHLQKNSFQQKKSNINLLINNLPHMLKHTLLFIIHKNYIENFKFFKKCYNSNFIAYTLINFKPISLKKSSIILKEDQLIDHVIFIGEGRISLEIAIDLENPEYSIKKYLSLNYNPLNHEGIIDDKYNSSKVHKFSSIKMSDKNTSISLNNFIKMNDKTERDFDESNYQFLNITNIFKNENYGEVFIIYNKPSPLFLRVKSKIANCLLLNKSHIIYLSTNYANIWNRLFNRSLKNMIAIKAKTIDKVKKYSLRYNIKNLSMIQDDPNNKEHFHNDLKFKKYHGELKNIISKNIKIVQSNRYSIASCPAIKVGEGKKFGNKKFDYIKEEVDNNRIENNLSNSKIKEEKNTNENIHKSNEFPDVSKVSSGSSSKSPKKKYPENMDDKSYIKLLEEKLEKEKKKRKYYQQLYEDLNKKNKHLYSILLKKTMNFSSIDKGEGDSTSNSNVNKMIINTINNQNPKHNKLNKRTKSMKLKDENMLKFREMESPKNIRALKKTKTKKLLRKKSKFERRNRRSITKNYFNITKNINIINKIENVDNQNTKENEKEKDNQENKKDNEKEKKSVKGNQIRKTNNSFSICNLNKKNQKDLNIKENQTQDNSCDIYDNSHHALVDFKIMGKNELFPTDLKNKRKNSDEVVK